MSLTHRHPLAALVAAAALLVPGEVWAQTGDADDLPPDTIIRIGGIDVRAERAVAESGGATALEVNVEALDLPAAATVGEVFREIPGLGVRVNSRGQAELTVRGSESRQVAVLLDGAPLTLAWDARTDVSVLPATALRSIRFVRGLSSVLRGPNVLGGVVELSLTEGAVEGQSFASGVDQLGGWSASATATRLFGGGAGVLRAGGGWRDTPAQTLPGDIDERPGIAAGRRLNTDFSNLDGFVAARYTSEGGAWGSASLMAHSTERGIAAELGTTDARFWRYPSVTRSVLALNAGSGTRPTPLGSGELEVGLFVDRNEEEIVAYTGPDYRTVDATEQGEGRTITGRIRATHDLGERAVARASVDYGVVSHDTREDGVARSYQQRLLSAGAEAETTLLDRAGPVDRLTLSLGGVWDRASTPESGGLPSLGTIDAWGARLGVSGTIRGGNTLLHAGVSRRGRFPSLRESYSEALNRFLPNPDLGPEQLLALEAGFTTVFGAGELQVVGFRHDLSDAIRRVTLPGGLRQRVNSEELRSRGLELFLTQDFGRVRAGGDLRLQSVELIDPQAQLSTEPENIPEQEARAWAELMAGSDLRIRGEVEYTGAQFCQDLTTGQDVELDGGSWLNAVVSRVWSLGGALDRLETTLSANNLTDTALYDQCGLPRPGRTLSVQLRLY